MTTPKLISIHRDGQDSGPYTEDQVKQYIASGRLVSSDLAWYEGLESWQPLESVPELSACFSQSAATAPTIKPVQTGLQFPAPGTPPSSAALEANQLVRPKRKGFLISFVLLINIVLWIVAWRYFPEFGPWKTLLVSIAVTGGITLIFNLSIQAFADGLSGRGGGSSGHDCSSCSSSSCSSCSSCGGGD